MLLKCFSYDFSCDTLCQAATAATKDANFRQIYDNTEDPIDSTPKQDANFHQIYDNTSDPINSTPKQDANFRQIYNY